MNQDQVKTKLLRLHDCAEDFSVIFSGKKSSKVNGLYKYPAREIIIHNRNFHDDRGDTHDNMLFYTAMHELAHHILITEHKQNGARSHTGLFYAVLDDLVDLAEKKKLYCAGIDDETQKLIDEAREISRQIAELRKKLGAVLLRLHEVCGKKGIRYEDAVGKRIQISKQTEAVAVTSHALDIPSDVGADIQEAAAKERDHNTRKAMIQAARKGGSVVQVKKKNKPAPLKQKDETEALILEKRRIERTIQSLTRRLEEVEEQLREKGG